MSDPSLTAAANPIGSNQPSVAASRPLAESDNQTVFSITQLARELDITTRTIRFYEDKGLLNPERRGQQRVYSRADRTRLKLVLRGKRLGWPLDEIRKMIELYDTPGGEQRQLEVMIERIKLSRQTLQQQRDDIDLALREFDEIEARCQRQLTERPATTGSINTQFSKR